MAVKNKSKLKICIAASAGGHLTQLLKIKDCWKGREFFFVTSSDVVKEKLEQSARTYVVGECNREHVFKVFQVLIQCIMIVLRERPNVVISTGAAPGFLMCIIAKILGANIIWLDSIANTEKLSMSGRMIRPFSDLVLSQWPDVADRYKNVGYVGEVI